MQVSVITPAYNDSHTAGVVLQELYDELRDAGRKFEIVVIDDASHDGTAEILKQFARNKPNIRLFFHAKNKGMAATYRELQHLARFDIIVQFSIDGEWNPRDVLRLIEALEESGNDMVIGVRRRKPYGLVRKAISKTYNILTRLFFDIQTFDAGSIKAMRNTLVQTVHCISCGVFEESERIIRARQMGYRIGTIAIDYHPSRKAYSVVSKIPLIVQACVDFVRVWVSLLTNSFRG